MAISGSDWPLGALELKVADLTREVDFYEWFGLTRAGGDDRHAAMSAGGAPILRLTAMPNGKQRPRHTAGLFHFAILLPAEQELGAFLRRAIEEKLPLTGSADHFVSQALYFDDPEGNGIEVYADRPRSEWRYPGGRLNIGTEPLDFERLVRIADPPRKKFSEATRLGHMHLNVADLDSSQAAYEALGMEVMAVAGSVMRFLSWDGYHHHLGINVLEGRGAAPVEPDVLGLRGFEIRRLSRPLTDPNGLLLAPSL